MTNPTLTPRRRVSHLRAPALLIVAVLCCAAAAASQPTPAAASAPATTAVATPAAPAADATADATAPATTPAAPDTLAPASLDTTLNPFQRIVALYQKAMAARETHDCLAYQAAMEEALALAPGHPILMTHLARALARQGQYDLAEAWLDSVAATGVIVNLDEDADFADLRASEAFKASLARMARNRQPVGTAEAAFTIETPDLLPEGIARDPDSGALYVGSIRWRKILRLAPDGTIAEFVKQGQDGLASVVGLTVDPLRRVLWACSAAGKEMVGATPADTSRTGVFGWSLEDGQPVGHYLLPDTSVARQLNDLTIAPSGLIYASDSATGAVWRLDPDAGVWEEFLPDGAVPGANGLSFSADGDRLYVSAYALGIAVVDVADRSVRRLACPPVPPALFVDGLYCRGNSLFAVQNWLGLARVTRFWLDEAGTGVVGAEVLLSYDPRFDEPTTAALADGEMFIVANSELHRYAPDGTLEPATMPPRFVILRLAY